MTTYKHRMIRHPRPMLTFDPSKPAMVYDDLNDEAFTWEPNRWSKDYYSMLSPSNDAEFVVWDGLMLTGWCTLHEWDREWRRTIVGSALSARAAPLVWVKPEGSGYALTEFGPYTAEDEGRVRAQILRVRPKLGRRRLKISRLRNDEVLYLQFDPPLDDADHLFVVIELEKELGRRQASEAANDNGS